MKSQNLIGQWLPQLLPILSHRARKTESWHIDSDNTTQKSRSDLDLDQYHQYQGFTGSGVLFFTN